MKNRFQSLHIFAIICFFAISSFAQGEEDPIANVSDKVISKSIPIVKPVSGDSITPTIINQVPKRISAIDILRSKLEMDLSNLNTELSTEELDYRVARILKVKKEETEADLLFIGKMDKIKKTIAYESLDNSQDYIRTAERFLDTLYNEDTEVSESFKTTTKERYDNYVAKEKVVKIKVNDLIVEELPLKNGQPYFKYSGFALMGNYSKKIRVEFFSDGFVSRTDPKWIYKAAVEDNIAREVTIEGVISDYSYGRKIDDPNSDERPISIIQLKEWLIEDKEQLIQEIKSKN